MRISDWSSDCSLPIYPPAWTRGGPLAQEVAGAVVGRVVDDDDLQVAPVALDREAVQAGPRERDVVAGQHDDAHPWLGQAGDRGIHRLGAMRPGLLAGERHAPHLQAPLGFAQGLADPFKEIGSANV